MANTFSNVLDLPQISLTSLPPLHPPPTGNTFNGEMMQLGSALSHVHPHQTIYEDDRRVMMMMMMEEDEGASSKKRRLGVDQVRFLESSFKEEKKLEPERKVKIAQQLGLQPRQVAIWFQNRRARSRSKQLERDYIVLKSLYDVATLEKQKLQDEVLHLKKELNNIRSTKQHEEQMHINKQQSMGLLKHALETQDASTNAYNSCDDYKGQDSHEDKKASLLPLTIVKPRDTANSACEGAIILRTTNDHDTQQPQCHKIITTNLAQHLSIKMEGEDCRQVVYSTHQYLDDNHHCLKFQHWHDIWSD